MLNTLAGKYSIRRNVTFPLAQPPCPSKEKSERYNLPNISAYPDSSGAKAVMLPRVRINRVCKATNRSETLKKTGRLAKRILI